MLVFALTVFSGAFLLFEVEPLIAKFILPWFGGGPGVWTTCLLFFQVVLLLGYAYAHFVSARLRPRTQAIVHCGLLLLAAALLPITPGAVWKPQGASEPVLRILFLLAACVGIQAFALSSTGPLLQRWFATWKPGASPYRLYALSNAGSLLALLAYPFLVEPHLARSAQAVVWSVAFGVFALLSILCAVRIARLSAGSRGSDAAGPQGPLAGSKLASGVAALWLLLPACGSILLLAVTNQLCLDVAVIPFLWILPLSVYLLTFILAFHSPHWYPRPVYVCALLLGLVALSWVLGAAERKEASIATQIVIHSVVLFLCCMICHGELARLKPAPERLTSFYLLIAAGGALGGVLVAVVAPLVFHGYFELQVGLVLCLLLALAAIYRDEGFILYRGRPRWVWAALLLVVFVFSYELYAQARGSYKDSIEVTRNFYGVLAVSDYDHDNPPMRHYVLTHGSTLHGIQFASEEKRHLPTTYYGEESGVGIALKHYAALGPLHVGAVGLGSGTIAAYGRAGDSFRFYEINPEVERLARSRFSYLEDTPAEVAVVLGDARISLEREDPHAFDVIVLDAFSSDAVPVHLLTREAFEIYLRHLKQNGTIAVHISNAYLDLRPVVFGQADYFGLGRVMISDLKGRNRPGNPAKIIEDVQAGLQSSFWVLVTRDRSLLDAPLVRNQSSMQQTLVREIRPWTDDDANLFEVLRD